MSRGGAVEQGPRTGGILLVDKPAGPTSHDVVVAARRALGMRRVGHFGTLDPFATGLLVCGVGPATRLAPFCVSHGKTYAATFRLGWTSTTGDGQGELTEQPVAGIPDREAVELACRSWTGEVEQIPPAFSAKHVGGERAHVRARRGEAVVLDPVAVEIRAIDIERYRYPELAVRIDCGPGTYVRALARDLGEALGTGAYCLTLRRLQSGPFAVDDAVSMEALPAAGAGSLRPAADAVADLPRVRLDEAEARTVSGGGALARPGIPGPGWVALFGPRGFIGLAQVDQSTGTGIVRPRRILYPDGEGP